LPDDGEIATEEEVDVVLEGLIKLNNAGAEEVESMMGGTTVAGDSARSSLLEGAGPTSPAPHLLRRKVSKLELRKFRSILNFGQEAGMDRGSMIRESRVWTGQEASEIVQFVNWEAADALSSGGLQRAA
jgi:hypothetical protein